MSTHISSNPKPANKLILAVALGIALISGSAYANIVNPDTKTQTAPPSKATTETQAILDRASHIAFDSASTVQKQQTLSVDKSTAELLKNYMATVVYVPKSGLPSDADALDEPWLASTSGTTSDGMVVPNMDDEPVDEKFDQKLMDMDSMITAPVQRAFLKLLNPISNALVSSPFGFRWGRPHQGIDLAAPVGTPIQSAENGKVVYSSWKQGYGNFVVVDHGHGFETHYAHCSKILVHLGQSVKKGQLIARVGNTGNSTGPHLHFEVVANGVHRNPIKFLNHSLTVVNNH
jgi:murein DD-endopeptidase MepM/ murein hydrolase activator NlpD